MDYYSNDGEREKNNVSYDNSQSDIVNVKELTSTINQNNEHSEDMKFPCKHYGCSRSFKKESSLKRHQTVTHKGIILENGEGMGEVSNVMNVNDNEADMKFPCQHFGCNRRFRKESSLKRHQTVTHRGIIIHDGGKMEVVTKELTINEHSEDMKFPCEHSGCNRCFRKLSSLKRHQTVTHKGLIISRNVDGVMEEVVKELTTNEVNEHENMKFPCNYPGCTRSFKKDSSLKRHQTVRHKGMKPYKMTKYINVKCAIKLFTQKQNYICIHQNIQDIQNILFTQVKPICTSLMQARFQTPLNLQDIIQKIILLDKTIQNTPNFFIISDYKLIEYITLPLFELYSVKELSKCDRFLEEYLNCLSTLLLSGWQKFINSDNFLQLFIMFMKIIDGISDESSSTNDEKQQQQLQQINMNKKNSVKNQMISENTKLACVKYLLALLPKPSDQNKYKVSQEEYFKILQYRESILDDMRGKSVLNALVGRCVYVLLEYVVEERLLELRVTTLETIKNLIICVNNPAIVAVYLPGVVSKLSTLIVIEQKENHLLLEKAVETLAEVISIVMLDDDTINKGLISKNESISELKKVIINDNFNNGGFICVERNLSWLKATKSQIKISIANTLTIRNHPSWKLRLAFVNFSYNLLSKCSKTLDNCVPLLVETLVTYLNDEYEQVSCLCQIHLATLHNDSKIKDSLKLIMKESFNTWLTSLPRYLTGLDENAKYNVLSLLSGFILFLGSDIQGVLNLTLERISDGLLKALEFDICNTNIIE
ncbi:1486_t:CDS:2, partial [Entrophospora sp. SA101]